MTDEQSPVCRRKAHGLFAYFDVLIGLCLGLVLLPFYAVIAVSAWWLDGRQALALWELPFMLAFYWVTEVLVAVILKWRADGLRAWSRHAHLVVTHVAASAIAWALASGLNPQATLIGVVVGLIFAGLYAIYSSFGEDPTEEEQREIVRTLYTDLAHAMVEHKQEKDEKRARRQRSKEA